MNTINRFNLRVYGILPNLQDEVLIVHESINDFSFTKFPGGGLELGEGLADGLIREFQEELQLSIEIEDHFYTTHFFQESAFKRGDQLISVYYKLKPLPERKMFPDLVLQSEGKLETLRFEWLPFDKLHADVMSFPIDKMVCEMLTKR